MLQRRKSSRSRMSNEVNAGSMADIAFLLLIFFLVTTTIDADKGILVKLPPWSDEDQQEVKLKKKNLLSVLINADDQLLVRGEPMEVLDLKEKVKEFITNPSKNPEYPDSPDKAIVSLQNDRGTKYNTYLEVYNELQAAYNELRDEESMKQFGKIYDNITRDQQKKIIEVYPIKLSEADPTEYGAEELQ